MATKGLNNNISKKKVLGLIGLIVFTLVFIFSCMSSFLSVGKAVVGTFGIMVYPMSLILGFICLAIFLGFSYKRASKPTVLFVLAISSILFVIHSIATFKALDKVVGFSTMKPYLALSYQKTTLLGSFGSILTAILSMLLGPMGTIIVFVICATIFIGLFFDYQFYGKYEEPKVKKLKTRALREKVENSDKNVVDGQPDYSFDNNEAFDEISVDAETYEAEEYAYDTGSFVSNSEVVDEISDEDDDLVRAVPYHSAEEQTENKFDTDFYHPKTYPDVFTSSDNESRKEFINSTYNLNDSQNQTTFEPSGFNFDDDDDDKFENSQDDELSKLFKQSEDDEIQDMQEIEEDYRTNFKQEDNSSFNWQKPKQNIFENTEKNNFSDKYNFDSGFNQSPRSSENERANIWERNSQIQKPQSQPQNPWQVNDTNSWNQNTGFNQPSQRVPEPPKPPVIKIPAKEQRPDGVQRAFPGLRYNPPPLSLLQTPKPDTGDYSEEQNRKSAMLEQALSAFNVPAKVQNIVRGPKITRYELDVPLGVSVKNIPKYEPDIQRALAAKTLTIRVPIPGSKLVGIELENDKFSTVYERELLESDAFQNCKDPLPVAIGKDISGEIVVKSLAKMVHLLIAGSTGSGKSVFIHNIVLSLLYKYSPDDLRLIMIDPKRVEFNCYNGLPHLITPEVVMGADKAINALKWAVKEMDRRYQLMEKAKFNNIEPYNRSNLVKAGQFEKFPYIVIIVDELAEIMQVNKKEVDACIQRLTQLARACGIHLILATQRPSVDIISGVIKNNVPSRVAFSLQSGIDSKTILGTVGAEKLLGQGDMIFWPTGTSVMSRLQAAYATNEEIQAVIDYDIKNNPATYDDSVEASFSAEPTPADDAGSSSSGAVPAQREALDEYFKEALRLVMQNGGASTSYLQRRLSVGYSRASRIIDQMEDRGYISSASGSKPRKILITPEQFEEDFGEKYDII